MQSGRDQLWIFMNTEANAHAFYCGHLGTRNKHVQNIIQVSQKKNDLSEVCAGAFYLSKGGTGEPRSLFRFLQALKRIAA